MRAVIARVAGMGIAAGATAGAQTPAPNIPVVKLPDASAKSAEQFGAIAVVRESPGGKVLVDDAARKQVKLLSPSLATTSLVKDTTRGAPTFYGPRIMPLIPFLADSTLFPNLTNRSLTVIDSSGAAVREAVMPAVLDVVYLRRAFTDTKGRVIFAGEPATVKAEIGKQPIVADSAPLVREDFQTRVVDTLAYVSRPLVAANGTKSSSARLPFDWRQLSDADKMEMIDSADVLRQMAARNNTLVNGIEKLVLWAGTQRDGPAAKRASLAPAFDTTGALISKNNGGGDMMVFKNPRASIDFVFDYYPPIRTGGVFADFDGNVWSLPTTSKQSKAGELVYDVINRQGELAKRVRVPLGRHIVGFGRNGTVYLANGSSRSGFTLERTSLPR
ncbi:MAG TPA: hypothetical protein VGM50_22475 [Gemmatimonadaceae bacterium]